MAEKNLFDLGQIVCTLGARAAMAENNQLPSEFLIPHSDGNWGDLIDEHDQDVNNGALQTGDRLLSGFTMRDEKTRLWVITEAKDDLGRRSTTTLLLPEEY